MMPALRMSRPDQHALQAPFEDLFETDPVCRGHILEALPLSLPTVMAQLCPGLLLQWRRILAKGSTPVRLWAMPPL
jgi:hypothetical protein